MPSRIEIEQRRTLLRTTLRNECLSGGRAPNSLLPSVRRLAAAHGVSSLIVSQVLGELEQEGLVYTVNRVGTFVGRPVTPISEYYLLLLPYVPIEHDQMWRAQVGFEERIAQLGGASLSLLHAQAIALRDAGEMPPLAGLFDMSDCEDSSIWQSDQGDRLPIVKQEGRSKQDGSADFISFDSVNGGKQATQYLLGLGHQQVAYIGLHSVNQELGIYAWSADREEGWRTAMCDVGRSTDGLVYRPDKEADLVNDAFRDAIYPAMLAVIARPDITAVVTANDHVAMELFAVLRESQVPAARWPAVVSFDNRIRASKYLLTSFNLPWEEIGRTAADLVWERRHGQLIGPPVHRLVQMRMIRRLTSRTRWSNITHAVTQTADVSSGAIDAGRE